VSEVPAAKL